jgi:polyhydroxybutyrate depolymerase
VSTRRDSAASKPLRTFAALALFAAPLSAVALGACSGDEVAPTDAGGVDAGMDAGAPTALRIGPPERRASLTLPEAHDGRTPLPLVVLLHGYGASAAIEDSYLGLSRAARGRGVYVLLPNGTPDGGGDRFWAATRSLEALGVDDVAYLDALLDEASATVPVDPARIALLGHSNGAFMAYRFACAFPERIAALAALAGTEDAMPVCDTLGARVSALHFHGTADDTILYEGGDFRLVGPYVSAEEMTLRWARRNGCADTRTVGAPFDWDDVVPGPETIPAAHDGCPAGVGVELWRMEGAPHIPSPATGATVRVLDWLLAHPRGA